MTNPLKRDPPEPLVIAGHTFYIFHDRCACGTTLIDLCSASPADIGKSGLAHVGQLTNFEYDQIDAYRNRLLLATRS